MSTISADGSDRIFRRATVDGKATVIIIPSASNTGRAEADAFFSIGRHLHNSGVPVPEIYDFDVSRGTVTVQDLGDTLFYDIAITLKKEKEWDRLESLYKKAVEILDLLQQRGTENFNTDWCFDTPEYTSQFAYEREALYFTDAFVKNKCRVAVDESIRRELQNICLMVDGFMSKKCLMHRDFQSRNLMIKDGTLYIIDFQGARMGYWGYDLASLLYDPYMDLPENIRVRLVEYFIDGHYLARQGIKADREELLAEFHVLALLRMLQALGAYGFLTVVRRRNFFEPFIKPALKNLETLLHSGYFKGAANLEALVSELRVSKF